MIKLDVISDFTCPWCYLGSQNLLAALERRPDHPFTLEWHPYQLDPDLPPEGIDRMAYMLSKFRSREGVVKAHEPLLRHAAQSGVEFDLPAIERAPNTLDAHRLSHWAALEGRQAPLVQALLRAYWREGRDIGDRAVLTDIAARIGLDGATIARLLTGDADRAETLARIAHSRDRGVDSVPCFIIAGQHVLFGAQPPETWMKIIDEISDGITQSHGDRHDA